MKLQLDDIFTRNNILRISIVLLLCLGVNWVISFYALSAFHKVEVEIETSNEDDLGQIYFTGTKENLGFTEHYTAISRLFEDDESSFFTFSLRNGIIGNLRLDPGEGSGVYTIKNVRLFSFFGQSLLLTPTTPNLQVTADRQSILSVDANGWVLNADGDDPYMIFTGRFKVSNIYLKYIFPLIFSLVIFLLLPEGKQFGNLPFLQDITSKSSSSGDNIQALDGLRGFAALLVLADHSEIPGSDGLGPIGVIIFFCLSGFLLTMPFAKKPEVVRNRSYLKRYFLRRIKRIVPMFYFIITIEYLLPGQLGDFIRTAIFIQGLGILWTVLQEVYFYILLPFIVAACYYLLKGRLIWCSGFLFILAFLFTNGYIPTIEVYLYESNMPLFIGIFMSGMAMCYLYTNKRIQQMKTLSIIADSNILAIVFLFVLFMTHEIKQFFLEGELLRLSWVYLGNYCFFIALFLFIVVMSRRSIIARIFSFYPLRAVGIVGYSFYLLHPYILHDLLIPIGNYYGIRLSDHSLVLFFCAVLVTYGLSAVTYTFIERPFLTISRRKNITDTQYSKQQSVKYVI